jgi:hypothetical protein
VSPCSASGNEELILTRLATFRSGMRSRPAKKNGNRHTLQPREKFHRDPKLGRDSEADPSHLTE